MNDVTPSSATITRRGFPAVATIPRDLLTDSSISRGARLLWAVLDDCSSLDPPPTQERLADVLGATDRSIRNWLSELVRAGWVEICRREFGESNGYVLLGGRRA